MRSIPHGERANTLTHAVAGIGFAVAGAVLVISSFSGQSFAYTASVTVFACALVAMYATSALYHASHHPARKKLLRKLDHSSIYLLIAGTYTPFSVNLGGAWGALLLAIIWSAAAIGIATKLASPIRRSGVSTTIYVAMGWLVLIAANPFLHHFSAQTLGWLVSGGLAYTAGTPFYLLSHRKHMHALWHGFVVLGSTFHLIAVASIASTPGTIPAP